MYISIVSMAQSVVGWQKSAIMASTKISFSSNEKWKTKKKKKKYDKN